MAFAGTLVSKKTNPSAIVGCVKMASRNTVCGNSPTLPFEQRPSFRSLQRPAP